MSDFYSNFETTTFQPDVDAAVTTRNEDESIAWGGVRNRLRKPNPSLPEFSGGWADVLKKFQSWILDPDSIATTKQIRPHPEPLVSQRN